MSGACGEHTLFGKNLFALKGRGGLGFGWVRVSDKDIGVISSCYAGILRFSSF